MNSTLLKTICIAAILTATSHAASDDVTTQLQQAAPATYTQYLLEQLRAQLKSEQFAMVTLLIDVAGRGGVENISTIKANHFSHKQEGFLCHTH